jgi:hypothetical protein
LKDPSLTENMGVSQCDFTLFVFVLLSENNSKYSILKSLFSIVIQPLLHLCDLSINTVSRLNNQNTVVADYGETSNIDAIYTFYAAKE